jgi:hypothetical protein
MLLDSYTLKCTAGFSDMNLAYRKALHLECPNRVIQITDKSKLQQNSNKTTSNSEQAVIWNTLRRCKPRQRPTASSAALGQV